MKQLIIFFSFLMMIFSSKAIVHDISVNSNSFSPNSITNVQVGDVIRWTLDGGSHTTTSVSVPAGASTWDYTFSGIGDTFDYTVTVAGSYSYKCNFHGGMTGTFTALVLGVENNKDVALFSVFPSLFNNFINVTHPFKTSIVLIDVYGKLVYFSEVSQTEQTIISSSELDKGLYILVMKTSNNIVEKRKIVKVD